MSRPRRIEQADHPIHVCTRINNKEIVFVDFKSQKAYAKIFFKALTEGCSKHDVTIAHCVLMGSHYHIIVYTPYMNLSLCMQWVNSRVAERFNKATNRTGHFWGARFHSSILDSDEYYVNSVRYIYMNPVMAGIVDSPEKYEGSSISFYAFGRWGWATITPDGFFMSLGLTDEERRRAFIQITMGALMENEKTEEIKQALRRRIYGSDEFVEKVLKKYEESKASMPPDSVSKP